MRLAINLSGHVRRYEKTFEYYQEHLLFPLQNVGHKVDIFISTWDTISTSKSWSQRTNNPQPLVKLNQRINFDEIVNLYTPKMIGVDSFNENDPRFLVSKICGRQIEIPELLGEKDMLWMIPMFYKIWHCNLLKKQHENLGQFTYDRVIRMRFDTYLTETFDTTLLNHFDKVFVDCCDGNNFGDVFWLGKSKNIDILSDFYLKFKDLAESPAIGPEAILGKWANQNKINKQLFPIKVEFLR